MAIVERTRRTTSWFLDFYRSSVGKKWTMAVTGIVWMGYVLFHMIGNLKLYISAEEVNKYAEWLREFPEPALPAGTFLWLARLGLLVTLLLHVHAAYALTVINYRARPRAIRYESRRDYLVANYASRTMRWTGVIVLAFIAYHLTHLTWGWTHPDFIEGDVSHNLIAGFQSWPVALTYIGANIALGFHLFHGAWSLFQSVGVNHPRFNEWRRIFAAVFTAVVLIGNLSFPILIVTGLFG